MNNLSRALAVTLMAATVPATIVLAQQADTDGQQSVERSESRRGPSAETIARMQDGRIAFAKEALKLTPEQEKLWAPVEEKIRANFEARKAKREAWQQKREQRRDERREQRADAKAKGDDVKRERLALPERMEKRSERLTQRAAALNDRAAKAKEFAEVLKPLYASFSEEQKTVAGRVLSHLGMEGRGHRGSHWAMKGRDGRGHGWRHNR